MGILLKATTADDYDEYYKIKSSPADIYWRGFEKAPDKDSFRKIFLECLGDSRFEQPEDKRIYLIQLTERKEHDTCVGFVRLIKRTDGVYMGYTVVEEYQRHGYATQALKLGIELAKQFDSNIYAEIRDDNIASQRVANKCGFARTEEYIIREFPKAGKIKMRKYRLIN